MREPFMTERRARRYSVGAELVADGVSFRVWAPKRKQVRVVLDGGRDVPLQREADGYFSAVVSGIGAGVRYQFRLDGDAKLYPDPASRFQPEGPHGPSQVVDANAYRFRHKSPDLSRVQGGHVVYELHVGTFTPEGTWAAAAAALPDLAQLGVTLIELMPVADFPGRFGWGYDGVNLFAPTRLYGTPDDLRRFIDEAHGLGMGVMLDVVYNHLGPDGNYLACFADEYFTDRYETEWGKAIHFDGPGSGPVRDYFTENAVYWVSDFRIDGLRFDATQAVFDSSDEHVLARIARAAREAAPGRTLFLVAENESQEAHLARSPDKKGIGLDALWNDDAHHSFVVALTGRREAYYTDYRGTPNEIVAIARWGYLYQGQRYGWQKKRRGTFALDLAPPQFVAYLENHDQVANSVNGARLRSLAQPAAYRAMVALLLLGPWTPMLFQGEEWGSQRPFLYFADHEPDLARLVRTGRGEFLSQFPSLCTEATRAVLDDPGAKETFERCKLDRNAADPQVRALYRDLLRLRREDPVLAAAIRAGVRPEGAAFGQSALVLRYPSAEKGDRLVIVNLGTDEVFESVSEPLLAVDPSERLRVLWTSENVRYGGRGAPPIDLCDRFVLPAYSALFVGCERASTVSEGRASVPPSRPSVRGVT